MELDIGALVASGGRLSGIGDELAGLSRAHGGALEAAATGNEGFTAVAATGTAADDWLTHVTALGGTIADAGTVVRAAARELTATDGFNADHIVGPVKHMLKAAM